MDRYHRQQAAARARRARRMFATARLVDVAALAAVRAAREDREIITERLRLALAPWRRQRLQAQGWGGWWGADKPRPQPGNLVGQWEFLAGTRDAAGIAETMALVRMVGRPLTVVHNGRAWTVTPHTSIKEAVAMVSQPLPDPPWPVSDARAVIASQRDELDSLREDRATLLAVRDALAIELGAAGEETVLDRLDVLRRIFGAREGETLVEAAERVDRERRERACDDA